MATEMNVFYLDMKKIQYVKTAMHISRKSWQIVNKRRIEKVMRL